MNRASVVAIGALVLGGLSLWALRPHDHSPAAGGDAVERPDPPPVAAAPQLQGAGALDRPAIVVAAAWEPPTVRPEPGGIVLRGHAMDVEGRPAEAGEVVARAVMPPPGAVVRVPVGPEGRFEVRLADGQAGRVGLSFRDGDARVSAMAWFTPEPGTATEGIELVAIPSATLTVRVADFEGRPVRGAEVALHCSGGHVAPPVTLDGDGAAVVRVAPDVYWGVDARSADGLWRDSASVIPRPGTDIEVRLRLVGPWSPIDVRCVSKPPNALTGRTAVILASWGRLHSRAEAEVDGGPVPLWAPPGPADALSLEAPIGRDGRGRLESGWSENDAERAYRKGLVVVVEARTDAIVAVVDAEGRALPGFEFTAGGPRLTDRDGRAALSGMPPGPLPLLTALGPLGTMDVDGRGQEQRVVVTQSSRLGGAYVGPAQLNGILLNIVIDAGPGRRFTGAVDPKEGRWFASVPLPERTPVGVHVETILTRFSDVVEGTTGRDDLDLRVRASELRVEPRLGRRVRPTGLVRIRGDLTSAAGQGSTWSLTPDWPVATFAPLRPGRYEVAFSSDDGKTWLVHPDPVVVGDDPVGVVLDFAPR